MSRRAKIVCTLGPATSSPAQVAALVAAGLDVARLNMSHGDHDAHRSAYDAVRAACDASGRSEVVATMARIIAAAEQDWPFASPDGPPQTTGAPSPGRLGRSGRRWGPGRWWPSP